MDAERLHALLETTARYPVAGPVDRVVETHLSRLYFVGPRVYKVKKPVDLGFVDFTTLELRRRACDEELRLNRRLSPETYLSVRPITVEADGNVRVGGEGEPIEWAVEMERLPAAQMLDAKLARGEIDREALHRLAARLARFHAEAARSDEIARFGEPEAVRERVLRNLDESVGAAARLDAGLGRPEPSFPAPLAEHLRSAFERFVAGRRELLARRVAQGRIAEGHGDLHAGNVCLLADRIVVIDAIEFSRALRCLDVAADLAFLLMDLDRLGFPAFARDLALEWAERTGDPEAHELLAFWKAHLACVRGKVAAIRGRSLDGPRERDACRREAQRFFALASSYAIGPLCVATCGVQGAGKSTFARAVAPMLFARRVSSDVERKKLAGVAPTARTPAEREPEVYGAAMTGRTYARLLEEAAASIADRRAVILDATFATETQRAQAAAAALDLGVPFVVLWCRVPDDEARRRLAARAADRDEVSDAGIDVFERARSTFEEPFELPPEQLVTADPGTPVEEVALSICERAVAQLDSLGPLPEPFHRP